MNAVFSGRFDRPHIGHVISISRIADWFEHVYVPVLDYSGSKYPIDYRVDILIAATKNISNVTVYENKVHFAEATKGYLKFLKDYIGDFVYVSNNLKCLDNVSLQGYPVHYWERSFGYSSSEEYNNAKKSEDFVLSDYD